MASSTHDSELMIQHVAAVAVPPSSKFITLIDEVGMPMVISLGTDFKLHVVKTNMIGQQRKLVDLGSLLRLADTYKASAFGISQDEDSNIYIALQTEASEGPPSNRLLLVKPFKPDSFDLGSEETDLSVLIMPEVGEPSNKLITSIFMANSNRGQHYPLVICAYQQLGYVRSTEDIARLEVNNNLDGWRVKSDLSLPENASKIFDLQPLNVPFRNGSLAGFATLYTIQGTMHLTFMSTDKIGGGFYQVSLSCPPGARSLTSLIDSKGFTGLLVGGDGLFHFESSQCLKKQAQGRKISDQGVFRSAQQLHLAQSKTGLTVWAANDLQGVGYLTADRDLAAVVPPVQVIPNELGGRFSAFRASASSPEQFIFSNNHGVLTLLQHDPVLGLWNPSPFFTPALETIVDIPSYTTQITLRGPDKMPLVLADVQLRFSGSISIIANGRSIVAGLAPVPVRTDQYGLITLIIPTNDISSLTFTVAVADGKLFSVDPTERVNSVLAKIQSGQDLINTILPSGRGLLEGTSLTPREIDMAAAAIKAAQQARAMIIRRSVSQSEGFGAAAAQHLLPLPRMETLVGFNTEVFLQGRDIVEMLWDAWHWLENIVTNTVSWSIQKLEDGAAFLVQMGETVYRWVMKGLTEVGKAISWILDKALELGEKVVQWLGFIFNWGDIQATHRSIVHLANNALSTGLDKIGGLEEKVDVFFDDLRTTLQTLSSQTHPPEIVGAVADGDSASSVPANPARTMKANWTQYQFHHGGASTGSVIHGHDAPHTVESQQNLWTEIIQPLFEALQTEVTRLVETITKLFKKSMSLSVSETASHLKTSILLGFVDGIQKLAIGIIRIASTVIAEFQSYINYKITVPVFSDLYKRFISGGTDLTLLDAVAMILAIPVTIITKIITNKPPPDMTGFDYGQLWRVNTTKSDGGQHLRYNHFGSIGGIIANPIAGVLATMSMLKSGVAGRSSVAGGRDPRKNPASSIMGRTDILHHRAALPSPRATPLLEQHWGEVYSLFGCIFSFPTDPGQAAPVLTWISWVLGCLNVFTSVALQQLGIGSSLAGEKALAVIEAALATINYVLIVAIKTIEFQASNGDGAANSSSILSLLSGTFGVLGTLSTDFGALAVDPQTKTVAAVVSLSTQALSYNLDMALALFNLPEGVHNPINARVM